MFAVIVDGAPMVRDVASQANAAEVAAAYLTISETGTSVSIETEE